jgi:hypothetical protein
LLAAYGLRGAIAARFVRRAGGPGSVHLVRRDLDEAAHAGGARRLQQGQRAADVRAQERLRRLDAAIDVALGREVDDRVDGVAPHQLQHRGAIANVAAHESMPGIAVEVSQGLEVSRVRQRIDVDDRLLGPSPSRQPHVCGTDKPAPPVTSRLTRPRAAGPANPNQDDPK